MYCSPVILKALLSVSWTCCTICAHVCSCFWGKCLLTKREIYLDRRERLKRQVNFISFYHLSPREGVFDITVFSLGKKFDMKMGQNVKSPISVILISNCNIGVFFIPMGCVFLAFWQVLQCFPNLFQFPVRKG